MKKTSLIFIVIFSLLIFAACGGYDKEFQKIQDSYIESFSMFGKDDSIIDLYMYTYAKNFDSAYNADAENQIPPDFIHDASYALATMDSKTKAYRVCSLTWDAFYAFYKGNLNNYHKLMDQAKAEYEKAVGMSMADYLSTVSDQDIMKSYKVANYSGSKIWK